MRVQADAQSNHKKMLVRRYFEHISHCSLTAHYNELDNESYTSIIIQEMYLKLKSQWWVFCIILQAGSQMRVKAKRRKMQSLKLLGKGYFEVM